MNRRTPPTPNAVYKLAQEAGAALTESYNRYAPVYRESYESGNGTDPTGTAATSDSNERKRYACIKAHKHIDQARRELLAASRALAGSWNEQAFSDELCRHDGERKAAPNMGGLCSACYFFARRNDGKLPGDAKLSKREGWQVL